ncbi:MAG: TlpA family protein disulfide reductase [Desulfovibrio sp.]|nr:TlpA family protein disulfide reductase [Desulfovibrio sp.]
MKKFFLLCAVFFVLAFVSEAYARELKTLHVEELNSLLEEHQGKVVMVNFFATWCPPCREEIPQLVAASEKYKNKDVIIVSLSVDEAKNKASVEKFAETMNINYPLYMAGRDLILRYHIGSIPHNIFYDRKGNMVISQPGECDLDDISMVVEELLDAK